MKIWKISREEKGWTVKLDVRILAGTLMSQTGSGSYPALSKRISLATDRVHLPSALLFGFLRLIGII